MEWKCMNNKFQALANNYFSNGYLLRFIYLKNVGLLFAPIIWYFK